MSESVSSNSPIEETKSHTGSRKFVSKISKSKKFSNVVKSEHSANSGNSRSFKRSDSSPSESSSDSKSGDRYSFILSFSGSKSSSSEYKHKKPEPIRKNSLMYQRKSKRTRKQRDPGIIIDPSQVKAFKTVKRKIKEARKKKLKETAESPQKTPAFVAEDIKKVIALLNRNKDKEIQKKKLEREQKEKERVDKLAKGQKERRIDKQIRQASLSEFEKHLKSKEIYAARRNEKFSSENFEEANFQERYSFNEYEAWKRSIEWNNLYRPSQRICEPHNPYCKARHKGMKRAGRGTPAL